jgi:hypothetical protein
VVFPTSAEDAHGPQRPGPRTFICSSIFSLLSQEQIKFFEEELQCLEETESSLSSYSDWYGSTHKNFKNVATKIDKVDESMMGKKLKTLEVGLHPLVCLLSPLLLCDPAPHHPLPQPRHRVDLEACVLFLTPSD